VLTNLARSRDLIAFSTSAIGVMMMVSMSTMRTRRPGPDHGQSIQPPQAGQRMKCSASLLVESPRRFPRYLPRGTPIMVPHPSHARYRRPEPSSATPQPSCPVFFPDLGAALLCLQTTVFRAISIFLRLGRPVHVQPHSLRQLGKRLLKPMVRGHSRIALSPAAGRRAWGKAPVSGQETRAPHVLGAKGGLSLSRMHRGNRARSRGFPRRFILRSERRYSPCHLPRK
jgi:hypothetical protein